MSFGRSTAMRGGDQYYDEMRDNTFVMWYLVRAKSNKFFILRLKNIFNVLFSFNNQDRTLVMVAFRINLNNDTCTLHVGTNY